MLTAGQECSPLIEIGDGGYTRAVAFTANGEYIVGGGHDGLGVWRVEDGKQMATMAVGDVRCLTVSKDGKWIAGGTDDAHVFVWDATTFEQVFSHKNDGFILTVDFSPDSTRLLVAQNDYRTGPSVWDVATRQKVLTLQRSNQVAKYSPQGDRIATDSFRAEAVRVCDSNDGRLLVDIPVTVASSFGTSLLWLNNYLFVVSGSTIKQLEASTGSTVSEWRVPSGNLNSCIALPKHGKFIAYSTQDTVTFWDTSTHAQLGLVQHSRAILSIALSPDDRLLAIGGYSANITIKSLSCILVSIVFLWIMADLNNFLVPLVFPNRIQSKRLFHIPPCRNLTFRSTTLRSTHGSTISSRMQRRY
jgi:WD40 repeat protein